MIALFRRVICVTNRHLATQRSASFTVKDVLRDSNDETGTLLTRFSKHIAVERYNCKDHILPPTKIRYADYFPITDNRYFERSVNATSAEQLPALIIHASSYRSNAQAPTYAMVLNALDAAAVAQLPNMETTVVLETLYAFLFLIPSWLTRIDFYHAAMARLAREYTENASDSKERFVQLAFYMGLQKKKHLLLKSQEPIAFNDIFLTQLPKHLANLTQLDLALVCNAAYKTSTIITGDNVRSSYEETLTNAVLNLPLTAGNDALLVCYIKALRLQRVRDERICKHLSSICLNPKQIVQLQPKGLAHIFAYFAEELWNEPETMSALITHLLTALKPSDWRAKDLATFLWACSQLNCSLTPQQLKQLEIVALRKLDNGEYDYFADNLVDTCLSFCTLGHYSKQLFDAAEELKAAQRRKFAQPKVDSRLIVLRSAVAIEQPAWSELKREQVFKPNARAPKYLISERTDLSDYAKELSANSDYESVDLVCPIAGINLPSLRVRTSSENYYIEFVPANQSLKFSHAPVGLLRLKCRLLEALGERVVTLQSNDMTANRIALQQLLNTKSTTTTTEEREAVEKRSALA